MLQVLNFARVPLRHQLVVMNGGTILDSAFLCWYSLDSIGFLRAIMVSELCALCAHIRLMRIHACMYIPAERNCWNLYMRMQGAKSG